MKSKDKSYIDYLLGGKGILNEEAEPSNPENPESTEPAAKGNNDDDQGYIEAQMKRLLPIDKYGIRIQLSSSSGKTNWIDVNKEILQRIMDQL